MKETLLNIVFVSLLMLATMVVIMVLPDAYWKEQCGRLEKQSTEHFEQGLYPDFFVTDTERSECKAMGVNL